MNKRIIAITSLIFTAAMLRLLPHAPNFTPIGAIALFGGAYINRKSLAYMIPLAAMLISDVFLGFYGLEMLVTYGAFAASIFIGTQLKKNLSWYSVAIGSVVSSMAFFLITNFALFYPASMSMLYTHDMSGIIASYVAGLPFFQNTLGSDLFFNAVLFGGFYLLNVNIPSLQQEKIKA